MNKSLRLTTFPPNQKRGVADSTSRAKKASTSTATSAADKVHLHTLLKIQFANVPPPVAPFPVCKTMFKQKIHGKPGTLGVDTRGVDLPVAAPPDKFTMAWKSPPENLIDERAFDAVVTTAQPSESVAVASSTAAYHAQYGSVSYGPGDDDDNSSTLDEAESVCGEDEDGVESYTYFSPVDIDDDDYVDINCESEDEMRSSFPRDKSSARTMLIGGPASRDTTGLTASEKEAVEREDKIIRKKWTDAQH